MITHTMMSLGWIEKRMADDKIVKETTVIVNPGSHKKDEDNKVELELNFEAYYETLKNDITA